MIFENLDFSSSELSRYVLSLDSFTLGRVIGGGGYGDVYFATYNESSLPCAIKKLFLEKLEGREMIHYFREVMVLSKCRSRFLLPLYGFTVSHPYCIVTEYVPNGSLFDVLRNKNLKSVLDPTSKTIIALGIAKGMEELHKNGVIHRDLKSLNVLLDQNMYPKICDFGVSRFRTAESEFLTRQIGTPHWMAPEQIQTTTYTQKIDVYAYGMLLWEIETACIPFSDLPPSQIIVAICKKNERPSIPDSIPPSMKSLICRCWHQNPDERPTFTEIFQIISNTKAYYNGTSSDAIEKFIKSSINGDENSEFCVTQSLSKSLKKNVDISINSQRIIPPSVLLPEKNMDSQNESPSQSIRYAFSSFLAENSLDFFISLKDKYSQIKDNDDISFITSEIASLLKSTPNIVTDFIDSGIINSLRINDQQNGANIISILSSITVNNPKHISDHIIISVSSLASSYPHQLLYLYSLIAKSYDLLVFPDIFASCLFGNSQIFFDHNLSCPFCKIIYHLQSTNSQFKEYYPDKAFECYYQTLFSPDYRAIRQALSAMTHIKHAFYHIPYEIIIKLLENSLVSKKCMLYMVSLDCIGFNQKLTDVVIKTAEKDPNASIVLCKISESVEGASYLIENSSWIKANTTFCVFLSIFKYDILRNRLLEIEDLSSFILESFLSGNSDILISLSVVLRNFCINHNFIALIEKNEMFIKYFDHCIQTKNEQIINSSVDLLFFLVKNIESYDFSPIKRIIDAHIPYSDETQKKIDITINLLSKRR